MEFPGSYRTVCNFIQEWRDGRSLSEESFDKNYERLSHPPAEAQLDFGLMEAVKDGKYIDVHCLVMTLPFSNDAYTVPLPGENQECLFYGMKKIFDQLGGIPRKIRIDNMKTAVIKPRRRNEETVFTNEFLKFANFYGFEPQACNAYSGNEKGNVENKVGYIRYNFINPAPVINDLNHLTQLLEKQLTEDRNRIHYEKKRPINELLEEELQFLRALPDEEYPVFKEEKARANKYGEIVIDKTKVYIPKGYNYSQLAPLMYGQGIFSHVEQLYDYGSAIRKIMYTTNAVESIHYSFRKVTKKGAFPNENALLVLFLRVQELEKQMGRRPYPKLGHGYEPAASP